ncbi:666_t:CDS:2 [Cetraspora pellucida]|uniref:666_t:CDS:1 n=1 Tax=Cetraspora pellucida TaxID=1433469 RepID=A0ACA9KPL7_9GLOM|nr:666_t:CDS:2 [Cetraspora pellucida]
MIQIKVNSDPPVEMELDINQTLYNAYDQITKNLNNSNDSRYKFFFMQHDEVGRIKLGPKKKLYNINKKVCDLVNNCEIQLKRELLVTIDDGKTAKKFICDNMLESYLSEIRKELNKKRMIVQNFKFLKEDLQEEYLHEVHIEREESITLAEILINDNVIRVLLNDSSISSDKEMYTSLDEEILFDFLSYDEKILCEPRIPFLKNEKVEHYKQHIYKCQLDYGLTFTNEGVILGTYRSIDFVKPIQFSILKSYCDFTAKILTCERKQLFFEKNMINLISNDSPSELQALLNHDNLFLNNGRYIYFTIVNQRIKLHLNKDSIKPSEEFKCAINKAIEGIDPYINYLKLLNVFAAFGNFFAQNIVIGKKLLKYVEIDNNDHIEDETEWSTIEDFRKISTKLENMLSYINNENLLVNSWVESCYQDGTKLNVIEYGDLISIYELFEEPTRSQIKRILDIHDHNNTLLKTLKLSEEVKMIKKPGFKQEILMIDSVQVDASVIYYRVKFKNKLKSDNYQLYGSVTTTSGQQLNERIIKFKAINIFGFSVIVENIFGKSINNSGKMNINWMLVGNPEIVESLQEFKNLHEIFYENAYFRNLIVVETGEVTIKPSKKQNWEISIETLPNLPSDAVFTCTFKYPLSNNEPSFVASVKYYNENGILVTNVTSHTHNFLNNPEKDDVNDSKNNPEKDDINDSNTFDYHETENDKDESLKYQH